MKTLTFSDYLEMARAYGTGDAAILIEFFIDKDKIPDSVDWSVFSAEEIAELILVEFSAGAVTSGKNKIVTLHEFLTDQKYSKIRLALRQNREFQSDSGHIDYASTVEFIKDKFSGLKNPIDIRLSLKKQTFNDVDRGTLQVINVSPDGPFVPKEKKKKK